MHRVFVYGSLRRGALNHAVIAHCSLEGVARTPPQYRLVDLGDWPGMLSGGQCSVLGELYRVDDAMLAVLDDFEDHPTYYERTQITLADGSTAIAYLLQPHHAEGASEVLEGDWLAR